MKLITLKKLLSEDRALSFTTFTGSVIPSHFHVTEVGLVNKNFIDCGGKMRNNNSIHLQLWVAEDADHKLEAKKLAKILSIAEQNLGIKDEMEVDIEYQTDTVGIFSLDHNGHQFVLLPKNTACLANEACGLPINEMNKKEAPACCSPSSNCC